MLRPDLAIFDCDGVIVDSEELTCRVVAQELTAIGWRTETSDVADRFIGGSLPKIADAARERGCILPDNWLADTYALIFEALKNTAPVDGAPEMLDQLDAAGLPYCIGSNGPQAKMDVTLRSSGQEARFEGRRFSAQDAEIGVPKPEPDLFLYAARCMGAAPERCIVVGDTLNDAMAAKAAGMPCFGYVATTTADAFRAHGAKPFHDMRDLPELIGL